MRTECLPSPDPPTDCRGRRGLPVRKDRWDPGPDRQLRGVRRELSNYPDPCADHADPHSYTPDAYCSGVAGRRYRQPGDHRQLQHYGQYTVNGAGNIDLSADSFRFVYVPMIGDGSIMARVKTAPTSTMTKVGVMMRETLDAASKHMFLGELMGTTGLTEARLTTAGLTLNQQGPVGGPSDGQALMLTDCWVKLVRTGNRFVVYTSRFIVEPIGESADDRDGNDALRRAGGQFRRQRSHPHSSRVRLRGAEVDSQVARVWRLTPRR
jgi:hypothetical protein